MHPSEAAEPCKDRQMLQDRMRADLRIYRQAVVALELEAGGQHFSAVHKNAERARLAYEASRATLDTHISVHSCQY
jgi:hypothetical protein